jgi:hypothetical protein
MTSSNPLSESRLEAWFRTLMPNVFIHWANIWVKMFARNFLNEPNLIAERNNIFFKKTRANVYLRISILKFRGQHPRV